MPLSPANAGAARPKVPINVDAPTRNASDAMDFRRFMDLSFLELKDFLVGRLGWFERRLPLSAWDDVEQCGTAGHGDVIRAGVTPRTWASPADGPHLGAIRRVASELSVNAADWSSGVPKPFELRFVRDQGSCWAQVGPSPFAR